jgi:Ni/Co efflux regulator RcnB
MPNGLAPRNKELLMKKLITAVLLSAAFAAPSFAASHAAAAPMADKKPTAQQGKMATCNKDAGDKKGDERKAFMKTCLSAKPAAAAASPACEKSADEKKLAGAARKSHIKKCMTDTKKG